MTHSAADPLQHTIQPPTPSRHVKVAIIGAGSSGQSAFKTLRREGMSAQDVVIINRGYWTTVCATVGCMPSKLLIAAGERAHQATHSHDFGIITSPKIDGTAVMARVQRERDRFTGFALDNVNDFPEISKIDGTATIINEHILSVNEQYIGFDYLIIASGTTPLIPNDWQAQLGSYVRTSDTVFEINTLPDKLAVIGAGVIGLELAQAFGRLGVEVKLFNRSDKIGGIKDSQLNQTALDCLSSDIDFKLKSRIDNFVIQSDNPYPVEVNYHDKEDNAATFECDWVLVATGRRAHLNKLGVQQAGIQLDDKGRPQDIDSFTGQIADSHCFVVGDANGIDPLLHVASYQGTNAAMHVLNQLNIPVTAEDTLTTMRYPVPLSVVFCDPNIVKVGQLPDELSELGVHYVVGEVSFANQGRSRIMGVNCGYLKIYAHQHNRRLLGAEMVAPDGEYLGHILALALQQALTIPELLDMPYYHPTIVEGLRTALRRANRQLL